MIRVLVALFAVWALPVFASSEKPLTIIVYTAPGGLIDTTARVFADIAEKEFLESPVIVKNKKGAGGLIALHDMLKRSADGHTLMAVTSSVISKAEKAGYGSMLDELDYLVQLAVDYECLITDKSRGPHSLKGLVEDAKRKEGRQLWSGPAAGGTDHLFAKKVWQALGIEGRWIPYRSGGQAVASVLGGHTSIYVGNPGDTKGRDSLRVLAVASPKRLAHIPETPTFAELNVPSLTGEVLWRGLVAKKGIEPSKRQALEELTRHVMESQRWQDFIKKSGVIAGTAKGQSFEKLVLAQRTSEQGMY